MKCSKKPFVIVTIFSIITFGSASAISPPAYATEANSTSPIVITEQSESSPVEAPEATETTEATEATPAASAEDTEATDPTLAEATLLSDRLAPEIYAELTGQSTQIVPEDPIDQNAPTNPSPTIDLNAKIILIDISEQYVWAFENGVAVLESPMVSGTAGTKRETSRGIFAIAQKVPGKYLRGPSWKCWVDYWMLFDTKRAIGLHDASWRDADEYNPETYLTDGSRGCVNLPCDFAPLLYDFVEIGTPVIVQD